MFPYTYATNKLIESNYVADSAESNYQTDVIVNQIPYVINFETMTQKRNDGKFTTERNIQRTRRQVRHLS